MTASSPQRFDALADRYASSEVHTSSPTLDRLHELLPQVESVCDVASGAGHTGLGFAGIASRIVAVDPAPNMLTPKTRSIKAPRKTPMPQSSFFFKLMVRSLGPKPIQGNRRPPARCLTPLCVLSSLATVIKCGSIADKMIW